MVEHRQHAGGGHAGQLGEPGRAGFEQRRVAAELVEHEAGQALAGLVGHERPGAVQVGERPAAVDVADEQRRGVGVVEHPVVDEVGQVDLRRAAGPLDDDELVVGTQAVERVGHRRPQMWATVAPRHLREIAAGNAVDHHLAAGVGLRLEEHGVHPHVGTDPGCAGLQPLGDADLAAVDDASVVRHVLRLERHDVDTLAGEPSAQRRDEQALAGVRRAPEHHQWPHVSTRSTAADARPFTEHCGWRWRIRDPRQPPAGRSHSCTRTRSTLWSPSAARATRCRRWT